MVSDKIGKLLNDFECEEEKRSVIEFIDFLEQNELIAFLEDPAMFPALIAEHIWKIRGIFIVNRLNAATIAIPLSGKNGVKTLLRKKVLNITGWIN
jgi:hypothetical protein